MYLNLESSGKKFSLEIVQLFMPDTESLYTTGSIRHYLDNFCSYQARKMRSERLQWDHAMLLTGLDLYTYSDGSNSMDRASSGMAFLSGMCSLSYSCTISEAR